MIREELPNPEIPNRAGTIHVLDCELHPVHFLLKDRLYAEMIGQGRGASLAPVRELKSDRF